MRKMSSETVVVQRMVSCPPYLRFLCRVRHYVMVHSISLDDSLFNWIAYLFCILIQTTWKLKHVETTGSIFLSFPMEHIHGTPTI